MPDGETTEVPLSRITWSDADVVSDEFLVVQIRHVRADRAGGWIDWRVRSENHLKTDVEWIEICTQSAAIRFAREDHEVQVRVINRREASAVQEQLVRAEETLP